MAVHCLSDDNNNTVIEDSVYLCFFELPSDLEGIPWVAQAYGACWIVQEDAVDGSLQAK